MQKRVFLLVVFVALFSVGLQAQVYTLSIQPILPKAEIIRAYQPLADYLSKKTGQTIKLKAHSNFLTYWSAMRMGKGFDLVLDAAHFTDFRIQKKGYEVLAKLPDSVSFSIVTHEDDLIFELDELVLKKVATMISPGAGALRLLELFPDPMHQPRIIYARDSLDAAQRVIDRQAFAAIIPSALVSRFDALNTVMTTEPMPHMGFSAAPAVSAELKAKIRQALLSADKTAEGQAMLKKLSFTSFQPASADVYHGYSDILKNVIGY
jgi:ABC-type phosphate/phosphonate transport system substrate-binding protein